LFRTFSLSLRQIKLLTGETTEDLRLLTDAQIAVCTVSQWDALSRRWRQRKAIQSVSLLIVDEIHLLGGAEGPMMEVVISRMRYLSMQLSASGGNKRGMRMIGIGSSIANAKDVAEWMGVQLKSLFNFSPSVRPVPLDIYFQSFDVQNFSARLLAMAKPLYNTILRVSDKKPVLVFVPSWRQAKLTAVDLMTYCHSLGSTVIDSDQVLGSFLGDGVSAELIAQRQTTLKEETLKEVASKGIGYLYEGMDDEDFGCITDLFRERVLQILICPFNFCWKVKDSAHLVVIMGTESYDGKEKRYVDHPISDLLQMMGKANRPNIDSDGKCIIFCHTPKKDYLKKLLHEPLPIESHLDHYLHDHINSEIVTKTIRSMQDAVDYITWTFFYRRLTKNPTYYNLHGISSSQIAEHISDMVETVIGDLSESKCCEVDDNGNISSLNLGMIAAHYYIQYTTVELMASSVTSKAKIKGIMEILSAASEFSTLPVRHGEDKTLAILSKTLPHQLPTTAQFNDPNTKALVLLQCHVSRKPLSIDLQIDQSKVVGESITLIQAIVDVISSSGWLKPALAAMELSQMVVQALWNKDHVLMQIPHFTKEIVDRCLAYNSDEPIESVLDILSLDDDVRNELLRLPDDKMVDVAFLCNNYPANIDINFEVKDPEDVTAGNVVSVVVSIERDADEAEVDDTLGLVSAPFFPKVKREGWWLVVGDTISNTLLAIKRVMLKIRQTVVMDFVAPAEPGDYNLTLFLMSDSYLGCDQEYSLPLSVAAAGSDIESDESDIEHNREYGEE
jgi:pre-mRNA-splicing helicase BRR2